MPCPLTEPDNYPDYLKKILKEVEMGKDEDLKKCLCSLAKPLDDNGCYLLDENKKIALFPGCLVKEDNGRQFFTLKEIMEIYWKTKSFKLDVSFTHDDGERKSFTATMPFVGTTNGKTNKNIEKVCPNALYELAGSIPGIGGYLEVHPTPTKKEEEDLYSLDIYGLVKYSWEVRNWFGEIGYAISQWQIDPMGDTQGTFNGKNINYYYGFDENVHSMGSSILKLTANF